MTLDGLNSLYSLCSVLGLDFKKVVNEIHPSLGEPDCSKNISKTTIELLGTCMRQLRELKLQRMQQASTSSQCLYYSLSLSLSTEHR